MPDDFDRDPIISRARRALDRELTGDDAKEDAAWRRAGGRNDDRIRDAQQLQARAELKALDELWEGQLTGRRRSGWDTLAQEGPNPHSKGTPQWREHELKNLGLAP